MPITSNGNTRVPEPYLKIGDVARKVGVSPSVIRSWESIGLARPRRTESKYRLYTAEDVKAAEAGAVSAQGPWIECGSDCAIAEARRESSPGRGWKCGGDWRSSSTTARPASAFAGAGGGGGGHLCRISQCFGTFANERFGGHAAKAGTFLQNKYSGFL